MAVGVNPVLVCFIAFGAQARADASTDILHRRALEGEE